MVCSVLNTYAFYLCSRLPVIGKGRKASLKSRIEVLEMENVFLSDDMNMVTGVMVISGVVVKCGVDEAVKNGQYLVNFCAARGVFQANTLLQHKLFQSYLG